MNVIVLWIIVIAALLYHFRDNIEFEFPVFMLKNRSLAQTIFKTSKKWKNWILPLADLGVVLGIAGTVFVFFTMGDKAMGTFTGSVTTSQVKLILPGAKAETTARVQYVPMEYWIITLATIIIVHELAHGVVASVQNLRPVSVALVLIAIIPGAGVELDEKKMYKRLGLRERLRIYSAGSIANFMAAAVCMGLLYGTVVLGTRLVEPVGMRIIEVQNGSPAEGVLTPGMLIKQIDEMQTSDVETFKNVSKSLPPNKTILVATSAGNYTLTSGEKEGRGYIGILAQGEVSNPRLMEIVMWFFGLLQWMISLNAGIGIINLMPAPMFDGGRMFKDIADAYFPKASKVMVNSVFTLSLCFILLNLFPGIGQAWTNAFLHFFSVSYK